MCVCVCVYIYIYIYMYKRCVYTPEFLPGGSVVQNPAASAGDMSSISGLGRSP